MVLWEKIIHGPSSFLHFVVPAALEQACQWPTVNMPMPQFPSLMLRMAKTMSVKSSVASMSAKDMIFSTQLLQVESKEVGMKTARDLFSIRAQRACKFVTRGP